MEINGILKAMLDSIKHIPAEMGTYEDDNYLAFGDDIQEQVRKVAPTAAVYNGCSKLAIVNKTCNYVVKIPFRGMYYNSYDESSDDWDEEYFEEFHYANDIAGNSDAKVWDYCENELIKYEKAINAGFGEFFAETAYYGLIDNTPVYIQEKAIALSERGYEGLHYSDDADKSYTNNRDRIRGWIDEVWTKLAIDWYGLDKVIKFLNYIDAEGLDSDLHRGNIGFTDAGKPVLIDWAGWRD